MSGVCVLEISFFFYIPFSRKKCHNYFPNTEYFLKLYWNMKQRVYYHILQRKHRVIVLII